MKLSYDLVIEGVSIPLTAEVSHWHDATTPWKFDWQQPAPSLWHFLVVNDKDKYHKIADIITKDLQGQYLDAQEKTVR